MSDDNPNRSYDEGRSGHFYSGGDSIDYAGYMAGREAAVRADMSRSSSEAGTGIGGGGGGVSRGPMDLKGRLMQFGMIFGIIGLPIGVLKDVSVLGAVLGFGGGVAVGVLLRLGLEVTILPLAKLLPFLPAALLGGVLGTVLGGPVGGIAGAVIVSGLWLRRRRRTT